MLAHRRFVDAVRDANCVERPQPLALWRQHRQAHVREPRNERPMIALVPGPSSVEPFLLHNRERLVERAHERGRHRMVIRALQPVVLEQLEIQIEAAALHAAAERARREDDRRQAGRRPETFLRAAIARVDGPRADVERMAAERADRIDNGQRAVLPRDRRERVDGIQHAGGGFGLHHGDDLSGRRLERFPQRVRIAGPSPLDVEAPDGSAVALAHLRETIAEVAGDDDERAHAFAHQIGDRRFHSRGARAGDGQRERPLRRPEQSRQSRAHIVEQRDHLRVEVADCRRRHRAHDARRSEARTGAEQNAVGVRQQSRHRCRAGLRRGPSLRL